MAEPLPSALPYEPPRIERVLTPEDLAHEVEFAQGPATAPITTDVE